MFWDVAFNFYFFKQALKKYIQIYQPTYRLSAFKYKELSVSDKVFISVHPYKIYHLNVNMVYVACIFKKMNTLGCYKHIRCLPSSTPLVHPSNSTVLLSSTVSEMQHHGTITALQLWDKEWMEKETVNSAQTHTHTLGFTAVFLKGKVVSWDRSSDCRLIPPQSN